MSRICNRERILWAKVSGYRHWPARIVDALGEGDDDEVLVEFFGTFEVAWLSRTKATRPWKMGLKKKYNKAPKTQKMFHRAIAQVAELCESKRLPPT